jgi:hypothetical protein
MTDPYNSDLGSVPVGPGFRVPFTVISPWTRNGGVFTESASHESQTLFLEKWAAAIGKGFTTSEMTQWRRQQMSDLTKMFDFSNKDSSVPSLPQVRKASQDSNGNYNGGSVCQSKYGGKEPPIPYSNQTNNLQTELGFKGESSICFVVVVITQDRSRRQESEIVTDGLLLFSKLLLRPDYSHPWKPNRRTLLDFRTRLFSFELHQWRSNSL